MRKIISRKTFILLVIFFCLAFPFKKAFAAAQTTGTDSVSISLWIYPKGSVASKAIVVKENEIRMVTDASGNITCQYYTLATGWRGSASATQLSLNSWQHVSCVFQKGQYAIYFQGVNVSNSTLSAGLYNFNNTTNSWKVGHDDVGAYGDFQGIVDNVLLFDYARTGKQVVEDMNVGHPVGGSPVGSQVAYWKFDEGQGNTTQDSGPNNNDGSLQSGGSGNNDTNAKMWDNGGKFGRAMEFDGTDDYVQVADSPSFTLTNGYTVAGWIKTSATTGAREIIGQWGATGIGNAAWALYQDAGGYISLNNYDGAGTSTLADNTTPLSTGQWYYVAGVYDGGWTGTNAHIYINGKLVKEGTISRSPQDSSNYWVGLGRAAAMGTNLYFSGYMDEMKVYNSALSAEQIKMDMNQGKELQLGGQSSSTGATGQAAEYCVPGDATSCAGPVGEWKFEDGSGGTAADTSGNGDSGTLYNSPTWAQGKIGGGLLYQGNSTNSCTYLGNPTRLQFQSDNEITVSAWVKLGTAISSGYASIYDSLDDSWATGGVRLYIDSSNRLAAYSRTNNFYESTSFPVGSWQFVTLRVIEGTGAYLYRNGILVASGSAGDIYSDKYIRIGDRGAFSINSCTAFTTHFPGAIDQVQIFNYARTPAQIAWDYNRGGPVGWWKLDDGEGGTARDSSGNGNTGTLTTMDPPNDWVTGKFGKGLDFDGSDDRVECGDVSVTEGASSLSVSAWTKADTWDYGINWPNIVGKRVPGGSGPFMLRVPNNTDPNYKKVTFNIINSGGSSGAAVANNILDTTNWHHLLGTWDGTTVKLYIDGILQSTTGSVSGVTQSTTDLFMIARARAGENFNGQIDDVRVYNYALTAEQIKQIMNEGSAVRFGD